MSNGRIGIQEYNGIQIEIDPKYGTFAAEVAGVWLHADTLEGLKKKIETESKGAAKAAKLALEVYGACGADGVYSVEPLTLTGFNRNDGSLKFEERESKGVHFVVPRTEENLKLLQDEAAARNALKVIGDALATRKIEPRHYGGRILATDYPERLKALEARFKRAVEATE